MNCIFCAIADGTIPSRKIYEDDAVLAFLDINPASYGHTLVIPKRHADSFLTVKEEDLDAVMHTARQLANHLEKVLGCDGINVLSNVHEAAGQSVEHFHVHLIPRWKEKNRENLQLEFGSIPEQDLDALQQTLEIA